MVRRNVTIPTLRYILSAFFSEIMQQMKNMRQSALEKSGFGSKQKKAQVDKGSYEIKELEWEINEPS